MKGLKSQILDSNLGRPRITTSPNGTSDGKNVAGLCTELYSFGGRSFSIWSSNETSGTTAVFQINLGY